VLGLIKEAHSAVAFLLLRFELICCEGQSRLSHGLALLEKTLSACTWPEAVLLLNLWA